MSNHQYSAPHITMVPFSVMYRGPVFTRVTLQDIQMQTHNIPTHNIPTHNMYNISHLYNNVYTTRPRLVSDFPSMYSNLQNTLETILGQTETDTNTNTNTTETPDTNTTETQDTNTNTTETPDTNTYATNTTDTDNTVNTDNTDNSVVNTVNISAHKTIYHNYGWYNKNNFILRYIKNNNTRCYQCYNMIEYINIEYVKLVFSNNVNKYKHNLRNILNYTEQQQSTVAIHNKLHISPVLCICKNCVNENVLSNKLPKYAPRSYGDMLSDYILNEKFDLITTDITTIYNNSNSNNINIINNRINYLKININEKQNILNNLINKNDKLTTNIDLEIEKFNLLNIQYINNNEIYNKIKNQLLQLSIDLFKENKKLIDEQINKYTDLNNASKYSIPECKICMMNEITIALQCGHTICSKCYDHLLINNTNTNIDNNIEYNPNTIQCPTCRTVCNTYIQLFL